MTVKPKKAIIRKRKTKRRKAKTKEETKRKTVSLKEVKILKTPMNRPMKHLLKH